MLRTTTPLVSRVLLTWLTSSYLYVRLTGEEAAAAGLTAPRGIGYGIGVGFGIFAMQGTSLSFSQAVLDLNLLIVQRLQV